MASLFSQVPFCRLCQTTKAHYTGSVEPVNDSNKDVAKWCQTAANNCLNLACGLSLFLTLTEDTAVQCTIQ